MYSVKFIMARTPVGGLDYKMWYTKIPPSNQNEIHNHIINDFEEFWTIYKQL